MGPFHTESRPLGRRPRRARAEPGALPDEAALVAGVEPRGAPPARWPRAVLVLLFLVAAAWLAAAVAWLTRADEAHDLAPLREAAAWRAASQHTAVAVAEAARADAALRAASPGAAPAAAIAASAAPAVGSGTEPAAVVVPAFAAAGAAGAVAPAGSAALDEALAAVWRPAVVAAADLAALAAAAGPVAGADPGAAPAIAAWRSQAQALAEALSGPAPRLDPVGTAVVERGARLPALADSAASPIEAAIVARRELVAAGWRAAATALALATAVSLWIALRQRARLVRPLRQFSSELGNGRWQEAVSSLRDAPEGPPSTFGALAEGVGGVLEASERRWQAIADLSADWYWETDARHRLAWRSPAARLFDAGGRDADGRGADGREGLGDPVALIGRRRDEMPCDEPPAGGWDALHARMDRGEPFRDVEYALRAEGTRERRWLAISGRPRRDEAGRFVGYEGVGRDVTERRLALSRLAANEARWALMARLASDWYWQTDAEHRMLPLEATLRERFPTATERVEGLTRWQAHPNALSASEWAEHRADLDARRPFRSLQFEVEATPGKWIWISVSGLPRFDAAGRFLGYHGVGRDITLRKQAERLLLRHNEELKQAVERGTADLRQMNLDLDAFARQLAHELRTPIGHVQGLAHLLETRAGPRLPPEDRELIALQMQAAQTMRRTVDALLQLARSTVQAMPMEPLDLGALAREVIASLPASPRRAPVQWRLPAPGAPWVQGSPAALRIVLANLLDNAAKFTREAEAPRVEFDLRPAAGDRVAVTLLDNGIGFPAGQAAKLFTPFQRLHAGDGYEGTGIGLTIVQRIVERHGGRVVAEAMPGGGARFSFTLGAAKAPAAPRASPLLPAAGGGA